MPLNSIWCFGKVISLGEKGRLRFLVLMEAFMPLNSIWCFGKVVSLGEKGEML